MARFQAGPREAVDLVLARHSEDAKREIQATPLGCCAVVHWRERHSTVIRALLGKLTTQAASPPGRSPVASDVHVAVALWAVIQRFSGVA